MNCRHVQQFLSLQIEAEERNSSLGPGSLSEQRRATALAAHLHQCPACRRRQEEFRALGAELRELIGVLPSPLPDRSVPERLAVQRWKADREARRDPAGGIARPWSMSPGVAQWVTRAILVAGCLVLTSLSFWQPARLPSHGPKQWARSLSPRRPASIPSRAASPTISATPVPPAAWGDRSKQWVGRGSPGESRGIDRLGPAVPNAASDRIVQDDLEKLNGETLEARRWLPLVPDPWERIEARIRRRVPVRDDFVTIPFPRLAAATDRQVVAATEAYRREATVVDTRLAREVSLQIKAMALSDLCERLRADTDVHLAAGPSVADEKVTLFCKQQPLREVMRQLSRPFGYTWLRSGTSGQYRYELAQDLKSQLLEEELRNRDRNEALLALEKEIERYRPYLALSPDEALARSRTTPAAEKRLLERYAGVGWGPIQLYFRLSPQEKAELRASESLTFSTAPKPGERPLPAELRHGVLQCQRGWRLVRGENGRWGGTQNLQDPAGLLLTAVPEVGARVNMQIEQDELGQYSLGGHSGHFTPAAPGDRTGHALLTGEGAYAVGRAAPASARNRPVDPRLTRDPALRAVISIQPRPSCRLDPDVRVGEQPGRPEDRVTTADVLEAVHRDTGLPIISDFYTRLYKPEAVTRQNLPLHEALNQIAETMRLGWTRNGGWLQFRSTTYYHDRLKEVPNRLLSRWSAARRQRGVLTLDDLVEIAALPDEQLEGDEMAEGAQACWGLKEWVLLGGHLRRHVRFLAGFTPSQRQEATTAAGLPFTKMTLSQQQGFLARALNIHPDDDKPLESVAELAGAALRVDYMQPGWYQWTRPGAISKARWVIELEPGPRGRRSLMPPIRERTREAALQAVRRIHPDAQPSEIHPTILDLVIVYIPGNSNDRLIRYVRPGDDVTPG